MKDFLSLIAVLLISAASFAQERVPVAPTKIDPKLNANGIPTADAPKGYEWQRWPGENWKLASVKVANTQPLKHVADPIKMVVPSALDEVNSARAAHGLKPFIFDEGLTQAALSAATYRAQHGITGHCQNDFAHLPSGSTATAAGCAAWNVGDGWGACCTYDQYTYAGAAAVVGRDGRRYMHLFVR